MCVCVCNRASMYKLYIYVMCIYIYMRICANGYHIHHTYNIFLYLGAFAVDERVHRAMPLKLMKKYSIIIYIYI